MNKNWTKGRGKLGIFKPLLGIWRCETDSEVGPLVCTRTFEKTLNNKYIQLIADWKFNNKSYVEHCYFGINKHKQVAFWSFTNDGKQSQGIITDVNDVHEAAIGFEAQMGAGLARQFYWPAEDGDFHFVVEAKNKKGWKRFLMHHYT